ncbi:MAG: hypothetical protein CL946_12460, partial [Ectothiorhodospiraceae bacterium]|nr:hypothetical protein [Ectothiorhodospiraceae bacterium]
MPQELIYTSAEKGLKPGSSGFCTVAATAGMSAPLVGSLERLCGYRHLAAPGDAANPVACSHFVQTISGRKLHLLVRIADAGRDYTGRTNKLCHHVVLTDQECESASSPAAALLSESMLTTWDGQVRQLPPPAPAQPAVRPAPCRRWQQLTGDAGWGGVLLDHLDQHSKQQVYIVAESGTDVLSLFAETLALLPPERRWEPTFTTYLNGTLQNVDCRWRVVLAGTKEAHESRRFVRDLRIDLTKPLGTPPAGPWVEAARTGQSKTGKPRSQRPTMPSAVPAASATGDSDVIELETYATANTTPTPPGKTPPTRRRRGLADVPAPDEKRSVLKLVLSLLGVSLVMIVGIFWVLHARFGLRLSIDSADQNTARKEQKSQTTNLGSNSTVQVVKSQKAIFPKPNEIEKVQRLDGFIEQLHETLINNGELSRLLKDDLWKNLTPDSEDSKKVVEVLEKWLNNQIQIRSTNASEAGQLEDLQSKLKHLKSFLSNVSNAGLYDNWSEKVTKAKKDQKENIDKEKKDREIQDKIEAWIASKNKPVVIEGLAVSSGLRNKLEKGAYSASIPEIPPSDDFQIVGFWTPILAEGVRYTCAHVSKGVLKISRDADRKTNSIQIGVTPPESGKAAELSLSSLDGDIRSRLILLDELRWCFVEVKVANHSRRIHLGDALPASRGP